MLQRQRNYVVARCSQIRYSPNAGLSGIRLIASPMKDLEGLRLRCVRANLIRPEVSIGYRLDFAMNTRWILLKELSRGIFLTFDCNPNRGSFYQPGLCMCMCMCVRER